MALFEVDTLQILLLYLRFIEGETDYCVDVRDELRLTTWIYQISPSILQTEDL